MSYVIKKLTINPNGTSLFTSMSDPKPKIMSWEDLHKKIVSDELLIFKTAAAHRHLSEGNKEAYDRLKRQCGAITPAVMCDGGHACNHVTGYTMVDMDHVPMHRMKEVLRLIANDPHSFLSWTTISGTGVRVIAHQRHIRHRSPTISSIQITHIAHQQPIQLTYILHKYAIKLTRISFTSHSRRIYNATPPHRRPQCRKQGSQIRPTEIPHFPPHHQCRHQPNGHRLQR